MNRLLKLSGYVGVGVVATVWALQHYVGQSGDLPLWLISRQIHLAILSLMAILVGSLLSRFRPSDRLLTVIAVLYIQGQWLLPLNLWMRFGLGIRDIQHFVGVWSVGLIGAMLLLLYVIRSEPQRPIDSSC